MLEPWLAVHLRFLPDVNYVGGPAYLIGAS
jgi:hypothetical protein